MKTLVAAIILILTFGCTSAGSSIPTDTAGWRAESNGDLLHIASGLRFPSSFEGLTRQTPHIYVASGSNASVGYERASPPLSVTFYIYPREQGEPEPADEFQSSLGAVLSVRPGATVHSAEEARIGTEPRQLAAYVAGFSWVESKQSIGGWLLLVPDDRWFHKVRTAAPFHDPQPIEESFTIALELLQEMRFGSK